MTKDQVQAAVDEVARKAYDRFHREHPHIHDMVAHTICMLLECNTIAELKAYLDETIDVVFHPEQHFAFIAFGTARVGPAPCFDALMNVEYPASYKSEASKIEYYLYCINCAIQDLK